MLTYELLTGASPFTIEGDKNTQQDISKRIISAEPMMPDILSPDVKDFILKVRDNWQTNLQICRKICGLGCVTHALLHA